MPSECEYDPVNKTAKYEGQPCHHNATTSFAAYVRDYNNPHSKTPGGLSSGNWHMCDCCAALPQFSKRKKNRWRSEKSNCVVEMKLSMKEIMGGIPDGKCRTASTTPESDLLIHFTRSRWVIAWIRTYKLTGNVHILTYMGTNKTWVFSINGNAGRVHTHQEGLECLALILGTSKEPDVDKR